MSHSYRTIPDAKFEFGIFSTFGDMRHKFPSQKDGTSHQICIFTLWKWV